MDSWRAADRVELAVRRALIGCDVVEVLDRAAVLAELVRRLERLRDQSVADALDAGDSYAAAARALGVTRQAVRKKYGR